MLLEVANLMKDQKLRDVQTSSHQELAQEKIGEAPKTAAGGQELS